MKVENFQGAKNQFRIQDENGNIYFQSYDSIIIKISLGKIYLDEIYWDYSVTTGKYRNLFLGETKKDTERKIKSGEYTLACLN